MTQQQKSDHFLGVIRAMRALIETLSQADTKLQRGELKRALLMHLTEIERTRFDESLVPQPKKRGRTPIIAVPVPKVVTQPPKTKRYEVTGDDAVVLHYLQCSSGGKYQDEIAHDINIRPEFLLQILARLQAHRKISATATDNGITYSGLKP